jgi:hypothetical protein
MEAILIAGQKGSAVEITSAISQPAPFTDQEAQALRQR